MTYCFGLRSVRAGAAAAVAAVVLVGCNGGGEVEETPTAEPTTPVATVTPSPTETESTTEPTTEAPTGEPTEASPLPELPEEAKENTPEGAEAFIRYYFDVANGLYMDPPTPSETDELLDELADPECLSCENLRDELHELSTGGWALAGELYRIDSMALVGGGEDRIHRFNMEMTNLDHVIESTDGEQFERDGHSAEGVGAAIWDGERWRIYDMGLG